MTPIEQVEKFLTTKDKSFEPDWADEAIRQALDTYLQDKREYAMQEYITLRMLFTQAAESVRKPVEADSNSSDREWGVKIKNSQELPELRQRLTALEGELFAGAEKAIDAFEAGKSKSLFQAKAIDKPLDVE